MRELIAYFRSKAALQAELLGLKRICLTFKYNIRDLNSALIKLEVELKDCQEDLARERRITSSQNRQLEIYRKQVESQTKTLAPFIRSPWGRVILELPWHEHAGFLEAFFGKPKEDAYTEWKRDTQIRAEAPEAGAGQPTGESE